MPECQNHDDLCIQLKEILRLKKQGENFTSLQRVMQLKPMYNYDFGVKIFLELEHASNLFYLGLLLECEEVIDELFNFLCCSDVPIPDVALGRVFLTKGILYSKRGDQLKAIQEFHTAAEIMRDQGAWRYLSICYNNIGYSFQLVGDIGSAVEYYRKSIRVNLEKSGIDIARTFANVGLAYTYMKEFEKARRYLDLSYKLFSQNHNVSEISLPLFNMVYLYTTIGDTKKAEFALSLLDEMLYRTESDLYLTRLRMAKALVLKSKKRFKHKINAEQLFKQVLRDKLASPLYCKMAIYHISEILLEEYVTLGGDDILTELEHYIDELESIARLEQSTVQNIYAMILRSHVYLIKDNIRSALNELRKAEQLAEENLLFMISQKISNFIDDLEQKISSYAKLSTKAKVKDAIFSLKYIQSDTIPPSEIGNEEPIVFMILDSNGMVQEKIVFQNTASSAELIALFLNAINTFFSSAFKEEGKVERITSDKNVILLRRYLGITFCYIFRGQSYWASKKLQRIIRLFEENKELREIIENQDSFFKLCLKEQVVDEIRSILEHKMENHTILS